MKILTSFHCLKCFFYSLFQNLIAGGQTKDGEDATNDLSFMCINATLHVLLPQPSFSIRVWNKSPHDFLLRAAEVTRTGVGLPAYYNDEVIIPALMSRGVTLEDAREYNIIGCVEPQKAGKTWGWHDAAFFNMCRPLELVFSNGMDEGEQVGLRTGDIGEFDTFEKFFDAYKKQMKYMISLLVNADNAIDMAHAERCPLPYLSSMVEDCIGRGKTPEQGGVCTRVLELGAGVKLDKPEAASIRKAIDKVLSNSTYREKAAEISEGFRRCAGAKGAAEKILSVISK